MEETFWESNGDWISAAITLLIAFALAFIVDRFVIGRATRVASKVSDTTVSRATTTRLRMIRRLVFAAIIVVGLGIALSQFDKLNKLANAVLASSAVLGLVLGFAAQKILANPLAGILLAISQPIRIGDTVTIEDETGRVERPDALAHLHRHRRRAAGDRPERDRGHERRRQPLDRQPQRARDGLGLGAARRRPRREPARRSPRSSRRRSTSPRSRPTGSGSRSTARAAPAAPAPRARRRHCASARNARCARRECCRPDKRARYPYRFAMTARQRRRHRRAGRVGGQEGPARASPSSSRSIGIGVASAGLWVLDVAAGAPVDRHPEAGRERRQLRGLRRRRHQPRLRAVRRPPHAGRRSTRCPKRLRNATIAIEDENFYEHTGVDYSAVIRAAVENFEAGEVKQGASTITQQLVRNLYIDDPEDTIERKIIEAEMAREYEEEYTKDEILEEYLNTASYGTNDGKTAVGVQAASQVFFNKDVSELNLGEAALLAGLPQAPTDYNPFLNPDGAKRAPQPGARRDGRPGLHHARRPRSRRRRDGLGLERGYRYESRNQQYFFDFVQQELIEQYGVETVREGGLKVYTTLDPQLQAVAEQAIAAHPVSGAAEALVSTDVETGEIMAMASSESYEDSQFNLAAQGRRQPGSSFKPYALTTAVDQGIDPDSTYYSAPELDHALPATASTARPGSVSGGGGGSMSLREATANSVNTVFAQLVLDIGADEMDEMAKQHGRHQPAVGLRPPTCSAPATSPCSTSRTASRRSPTAASTTTRPRSRGSSSPTARSTSPRIPRAPG